MPFVSEKTQFAKLREYGLTIQTEFWEDRTIRIRRTDHSRDDDVHNGIILRKKYYQNGKLLHTERNFSPMMMYTYLGGNAIKESVVCPNCGFEDTGAAFHDGCPYCGAAYNIEYADRKEGAQFFASRNEKDARFYVLAMLLCLAVCLPAAFFLVRVTGRTFFFFDKLKALLGGLIAALILFYLFYVGHVFVITRRAEENYEKQTQLIKKFREELLLLGIPLNTFYNNLHSELGYLLYGEGKEEGKGGGSDGVGSSEDVVDMNVLEYRDFQVRKNEKGQAEIGLTVRMRKVCLKGGNLKTQETDLDVVMEENKELPDELHPGVNQVHCRGCGAPVDVTRKNCPYCGARINYRQRLYIAGA